MAHGGTDDAKIIRDRRLLTGAAAQRRFGALRID
jgi:hypothetical protein